MMSFVLYYEYRCGRMTRRRSSACVCLVSGSRKRTAELSHRFQPARKTDIIKAYVAAGFTEDDAERLFAVTGSVVILNLLRLHAHWHTTATLIRRHHPNDSSLLPCYIPAPVRARWVHLSEKSRLNRVDV
jgi:hypothetical protein